jgi:hypothetical protein
MHRRFTWTAAQVTVASNADWNRSIGSGASFSVGFNGTFSGANNNPPRSHSMALPNAPLSGHWFQAQFEELLRNAFPPL